MNLHEIPFDKFTIAPHDLLKNKWLLFTCGSLIENDFNCMTIAWGSFGTIWNKPFFQAVVRPTRFTHSFSERYDNFTITAFPAKYKSALSLLGTKSGKDCNKIAEAGLTPIQSTKISSPAFEEAELIIECVTIYRDSLKPENFIDPANLSHYPLKDFHTIYFGEIVSIHGNNNYL